MRRHLVVLLAFGLAACSARQGDLTMVATRNIGHPYRVIVRDVTGQDCNHRVLFLPFGSLAVSLEEAIDRAVRTAPDGDMLVNASVYYDFLPLILYNRYCIRVRGDVVRSVGNAVREGHRDVLPRVRPEEPGS